MSNFNLTDIELGAKQWADDLVRAANRGERISTMYVQPADLVKLCASHRELIAELEQWQDWSNSIADRMPEQYDGDDAQEAIIDRWISDLRAENARLRSQVENRDAVLQAFDKGAIAIPADPADRALLLDEAMLTPEERGAIDRFCYEQQRERAQGVVPADEAGRQ